MPHSSSVEVPPLHGEWPLESITCIGANLVGWVVVDAIDSR